MILVAVDGEAARAAVPRHPSHRALGWRAGTALGGVPPELPEEPQVLRRLHRPERRHARRRVQVERRRVRRSDCGSCSSSSSRTRTTTAGSSSSARTGCSTSAWATAAPAATREPRAEPLEPPRQAADDQRRRARRSVAIAGYGLRNPWRFSFDKARQPLHRRRRAERMGGDRLHAALEPRPRELRLERLRGHARLRGETPNSAGHLVMPVAEYSHSNGCSVTGGYVWKGRYYYGDYCSGRDLVASDRRRRGNRRARGVDQRSRSLVVGARRAGQPLRGRRSSGTIYRVTASRRGAVTSRAAAAERGVGERLERLVQLRELARDSQHAFVRLEPPVDLRTSTVSRSMRSSSASSWRSATSLCSMR